MAVSPPSASYELSDYGGVLRRRWWIVLLVTCIGVLGAGAYVAFAHKTYTSTVLVQVNALPTNSSTAASSNATNGRTTGAVNMDNEAEDVQSASVAALANKQLHSPLSLQQLTKQIFVAVPPNTTFLQISCKASSAREAANCANDFGNAYLAESLAKAVTATSHTQSTIAASISKLTSSIRALRLQVSYLPAKAPRRIADRVTLNVDNIALGGLESQLNQTTAELASLGTGSAGTIASPALPPTAPSNPRLLLLLPSGLVAGLVIGLIAAFFVDRRDKRIHASRDLERFFGVPVLLNSVTRSGLQKSIVSPATRSGQAFAQLAQSVATSFGHGDHILLVAGTSSGTSSGIIAANLAATMARSRADVVLVCAGDRETAVTRLLGTGKGPGLSELLAGTASLSEAARQVSGHTTSARDLSRAGLRRRRGSPPGGRASSRRPQQRGALHHRRGSVHRRGRDELHHGGVRRRRPRCRRDRPDDAWGDSGLRRGPTACARVHHWRSSASEAPSGAVQPA